MPRIAQIADTPDHNTELVIGAWYRNTITEEIGQVARDDGESVLVKTSRRVTFNLQRHDFVNDWRPLQSPKPHCDKPDYDSLVKALHTALAYIDSELYPRTHKHLSSLAAQAGAPNPDPRQHGHTASCLTRRSLRT